MTFARSLLFSTQAGSVIRRVIKSAKPHEIITFSF